MATNTKETAETPTVEALKDVKEVEQVETPKTTKTAPRLNYGAILKEPQFKAHKFILQFILNKSETYTVEEVQALLDKAYNKEVH